MDKDDFMDKVKEASDKLKERREEFEKNHDKNNDGRRNRYNQKDVERGGDLGEGSEQYQRRGD